MPKYAATLIGTSALALIHVLAVVVPVISSHANGEAQLGAVILFDWPLELFCFHVLHTESFGLDSQLAYKLKFCVGGTLMYALVGALTGAVIDVIRYYRRLA